ncbi:hypothetical protein EXN51_07395 [Agrobacterium fabrum]|uniref:Uncharacterized protein n=1 Tax=Agrobacterium fabrum (strain C58 / ATCC 33970) TaxID=176299 RepID=Q8UBK8_AGRFC|nr:hypothetical protein Atu3008 [Agrobacterium fabrum str. C58]TRB29626.1 hypothetical protein EXN51_07395 [Agrobacterium fabrum]
MPRVHHSQLANSLEICVPLQEKDFASWQPSNHLLFARHHFSFIKVTSQTISFKAVLEVGVTTID